jgi:DNA replication protein DnaC
MIRIGVPRRHVENFDKRRESYAVSEGGKWPFRGFLLFCGKTGSGKSFGAASVIYKHLENSVTDHLDPRTWEAADRAGYSVLWHRAKDIADDRETYARASAVFLLAMDDLGREEDTKMAIAAMCSVISRRYDAKLPTVITTELPMSGIGNRYGRFFTDRLTEDAEDGGNVVDCGGISMRRVRRV